MTVYMGVPITEYRLLMHCIIFTVMFVLLTVAISFGIGASLSMKNKKDRQHVRRLKRRAKNEEIAKAQLDKIKRKNKRRRREHRGRVFAEILLWALFIAIAAALLVLCVIPGWMDYILKDYTVYTGEIKVYDQMKNSRIELADGTTVWGNGDFDPDDTYGTVVYAKRSNRLLGVSD